MTQHRAGTNVKRVKSCASLMQSNYYTRTLPLPAVHDHRLVFSRSFTPNQSNKVQEVSRVVGYSVIRPGQILDLRQLPAVLTLKHQEPITHTLQTVRPNPSAHQYSISCFSPLCESGSCPEPRRQNFPPQSDRKPGTHRRWRYGRDWANTDDISPAGAERGLVSHTQRRRQSCLLYFF